MGTWRMPKKVRAHIAGIVAAKASQSTALKSVSRQQRPRPSDVIFFVRTIVGIEIIERNTSFDLGKYPALLSKVSEVNAGNSRDHNIEDNRNCYEEAGDEVGRSNETLENKQHN